MQHQKTTAVSTFIFISMFVVVAVSSAFEVSSKNTGNRETRAHSQSKPSKELEAIALKTVSEQHSIALADLELEGSSIVTYRYSGRTVNEFNIGDKRNDNVYQVLLDDNGQPIDHAKLLQEEEAARAAKYGKLSEDLFQYLQQATPDEEIAVVIWLDLGPDTDRPNDEPAMDSEKFRKMTARDRRRLGQKTQDFDQRWKTYNAARAQRVMDPVVQRLRQLGYQPNVIEGTGYLGLKVKPAVIRQIGNWSEVRQISRDRIAEPAAPRRLGTAGPTPLDISRPTIGANLVENRGINGQNANVAQIEVGGRIIPAPGAGLPNPYLNNITQDDNFVCAGPAQEHACYVAGIIHSSATLPPVFRGISPGAGMLATGSCGGVVGELENRTQAAIALGNVIVNHSWMVQTHDGFGNNVVDPIDNFFDDRVYTDRTVQVVAAGNNGPGFGDGSGRVVSPAKGYNVISVGNFNDMNTTNWADDAIYPSSSTVPPTSAHQAMTPRIKPEVVAPGRLIFTTLAGQRFGQWFGDHFDNGDAISGTSFAAPHVTGEAALVVSRAITTYGITGFNHRPELVKAIIMASAGHNNIPGGGVERARDGISASWADDVLTGFYGGWGYSRLGCADLPFTLGLFDLQPGLRTRIVICWSQMPTYGMYYQQPSANLGLRLRDPFNAIIAQVNNQDDTFQVFDGSFGVGGLYTLVVRGIRCDMDPGLVAWAFWQFH